MTDVTTVVLDELNTFPGTDARPGLSRMDRIKPVIFAFVERYLPESFDSVQTLSDSDLMLFLQNIDKPMLNFEFDTQEKNIRLSAIDDDTVSDQTLSFSDVMPQPDFETIIIERDGDVHPKLIAVSVPRALDTSSFAESGGMPFHIYFHPTVGQNLQEFYTAVAMQGRESLKAMIDGNYAPYGWDFLFLIILRNLTFNENTNIDGNDRIDQWAGKGLLYQIANARKDIINVIPVLDPSKNAGDFEDPAALLQILKEIQQFLLLRAGNDSPDLLSAGRTAVSAFSSGHAGFNRLLSASANDDLSEFYGDTLCEVYMFDAPAKDKSNDTWVSRALAWAKKYGDEKVVRGYSQWAPTNGNALLAPGQAIKTSKLVVNSENPNRSFALLGSAFFKDVIQDTDWQSIHQAIPSLMLSDALSRSQF